MSLTNAVKTTPQAEQMFSVAMEKPGPLNQFTEKPRCEKEHQKLEVRLCAKSWQL